MRPRICVSIIPKNNVQALGLIEKADEAQADLIEVRLDHFDTSADLSEIAKSTETPLIATNKLIIEHGFFPGNDNQRQLTLLNAAKNGFEYVDVDLSSLKHREAIEKLRISGVKTIVSYHNFEGGLGVFEMGQILKQETALEASVCKIVTTAKRIEDNLTVLNFVSTVPNDVKIVCFCMGQHGRISRILSPMFGAAFTFASIDQRNETASGQLTIEEMKSAYNLLGV